MLTIGRPNRIVRGRKLSLKLSRRRTTGRLDHINPSCVNYLFPDPVGDQGPIGREARATAVLRDQPRFAAQGWDNVEAAAIAVGAEGDFRAIGREGRLRVVERAVSEADGRAAAELLDVDVEIAFAAAIGSVGQQLAVGRECRIGREAGIGSETYQVGSLRGSGWSRAGEPPSGAGCKDQR